MSVADPSDAGSRSATFEKGPRDNRSRPTLLYLAPRNTGMTLQAIRLDVQQTRLSLYRQDLGPDVRGALISAKETGIPQILIISEDDAAALEHSCGDLIVHKVKKGNRALSQIALNLTHIPVIRGEYKKDGKVVQSASTLLEHAQREGDKNVYLIVVNGEIFRAMWARAVSVAIASLADPSARADGAHSQVPAQTMIELMSDVNVPERLIREFIGDSVEVVLARKFIVKASENEEPVLILGDSGTGKEVVARLIHDLSPRRTATFMAVNCGAIPRELFESELFGFEKGAHSMAFAPKNGLWRVADGGTLFLDEVADLPLDHQVKILRVLDQGEILPVGAEKPIPVNARIISATNKDLFAMVLAGQFREDLYYRLRAMCIRTHPLRSHPTDIPALAQALWKKATRDRGCELSAEVIAALRSHAWPGNVRDLKSFLATLCNLFGPKDIRLEHVNAVFGFERQPIDAEGRNTVLGNPGAIDLQRLRHLFYTDEVLRAVQVPMRFVNMGRERTPENFRSIAAVTEHRVNEFEVLCGNPLLFNSIPTFYRIRRLKEKLRHFAEMMRTDPDSALLYWKRELEPEFADALNAVFEEVDRLKRTLKK